MNRAFPMTKLRDLGLLLTVTGAFGISLFLFTRAAHFRVTSPWFVLMAMFCLLGLVGFARPLFLLRLPHWLRKMRRWETRGKPSRVPGVRAFGSLLRRTPLRLLNPQVFLRPHAGGPAMVNAQLEAAEAAHYLAAALILPYMVYAWAYKWWSVLFWFTVVQVAVNAYPIFHLRWVRGRLERVSRRRGDVVGPMGRLGPMELLPLGRDEQSGVNNDPTRFQ
jgi:hypothetical protein